MLILKQLAYKLLLLFDTDQFVVFLVLLECLSATSVQIIFGWQSIKQTRVKILKFVFFFMLFCHRTRRFLLLRNNIFFHVSNNNRDLKIWRRRLSRTPPARIESVWVLRVGTYLKEMCKQVWLLNLRNYLQSHQFEICRENSQLREKLQIWCQRGLDENCKISQFCNFPKIHSFRQTKMTSRGLDENCEICECSQFS